MGAFCLRPLGLTAGASLHLSAKAAGFLEPGSLFLSGKQERFETLHIPFSSHSGM